MIDQADQFERYLRPASEDRLIRARPSCAD